jgi:hypothetical protein
VVTLAVPKGADVAAVCRQFALDYDIGVEKETLLVESVRA